MSILDDKINIFLKRHNHFIKPLSKILDNMKEKCKYINEESLERHNWGTNPNKLKYIETLNKNDINFETNLLDVLEKNETDKIDNSIIELLWGDIQLGKRIQACIIMWISIYILKRPVLYVFRNLQIDQTQLQNDIIGTTKDSFNTQFIENFFQEFNTELEEHFNETNIDYYKEFRLPELKNITNNNIIDRLNNKRAINPNDILCCLMNDTQLDKINQKFNEYIYDNNELVNMTILVDESDLMAPTASNDKSSENDVRDSTKCEKLLAKIYKKVKYVLHITGTAHSLLYNITTRLSEQDDIQIKISKVHKMKRSNNYYGLFNNSINFNTKLINPWWLIEDEDSLNKQKYTILDDYEKNIKNIILTILKRTNYKYNSLLISEEKIRAKQFKLVNTILKDFSKLFIIIYHGDCLRLYLSKEYVKEIKRLALWEAGHDLDSDIEKPLNKAYTEGLWQDGGIYGKTIDNESNIKFPNNYEYFDINTKKITIKLVYKLIRILFEKSNIPIINKTVITITGKYGERGYSFVSDNYDKYSFHLTDQYFVSHATFNCTDISQRLRLQGKYSDIELHNKITQLTLWTTDDLKDVIQNFYVKFIKEIEKKIMNCNNWEDIKNLLENIIDSGQFKYGKYMKYIDVKKKRKNIQIKKQFDKKFKGYKITSIDNCTDDDIKNKCEEFNLPKYICINEIKQMDKNIFIEKYGKAKIKHEFFKLENFTIENINNCIDQVSEKYSKKLNYIKKEWHQTRVNDFNEYGYYVESLESKKQKIDKNDVSNKLTRFGEISNATSSDRNNRDAQRTVHTCYDKDILHLCVSLPIDEKELPNPSINYISDTPYLLDNNNVIYSVLKEEYKNNLSDNYYWKTCDDWLYLSTKEKSEIFTLNITEPKNNSIENDESNINITINSDIKLYILENIKKSDIKNLRIGINDIYQKYIIWCNNNNKIKLKKNDLKNGLYILNYKMETTKGIDINGKPGKRGYNINIKP
jgi:hypothetical protein